MRQTYRQILLFGKSACQAYPHIAYPISICIQVSTQPSLVQGIGASQLIMQFPDEYLTNGSLFSLLYVWRLAQISSVLGRSLFDFVTEISNHYSTIGN